MDEIKPILLLIFSGFIIRYSLIWAGQSWARSYSQTIAFLILPIITYVITKTISGNIALSLGMIGALSIVRFRHPVKSALELVIYFDLITLGIAASVRTKWAIQLIICTILIIIVAKIFQKIFTKFGKSFYSTSFNEGITLNTIEIESEQAIEDLDKNENLVSFLFNKENNKYIYRLCFEDKNKLAKLKKLIENNKNIKIINIDLI